MIKRDNLKKQLLIIGHVWPEPASSAAGSRMMQLIAFFQKQNWRIAFASPAVPGPHKADLQALGIAEHTLQLNCRSFDDFISALQPRLVLFDRFMTEEQFGWRVEKNCPAACRVLDTEDLHFLRQARHQAVKQQRKLHDEDLYSELAMREVASILRCDLTLMISDFEKKLLTELFSVDAVLLHHLPFMLPPLSKSPDWPGFQQRQHFITIGNFRHAPNWDAVLQLKHHIWPRIHKALPEAELHIYGAYPPPKATALNAPQQGFFVKGWAEDAGQVMQNARLCLAPLRFGAGIKGKLTEAMQFGTPTITTSIGAESMHADLPWNGVISDSPEAFAEAAIALYREPAQWQRFQQRGINLINMRYNRERLAPKLASRLDETMAQLEKRRLKNFTGRMLRLHNLKSTQYMSQWIEAKTALQSLQS